MKPAELYIFDESFNAVDPDTLSLIVPQILKRLKGKTVIVVSHQTGFDEDTFDVVVKF